MKPSRIKSISFAFFTFTSMYLTKSFAASDELNPKSLYESIVSHVQSHMPLSNSPEATRGVSKVPLWRKNAVTECQNLLTQISGSIVSQTLKTFGFKNLVHKTTIQKVVSIIKTGILLTGEKVPIYEPIGLSLGKNIPGKIFLDLSQLNEPIRYQNFFNFSDNYKNPQIGADKEAVYLVFDLSVLDSLKFHISILGWTAYGKYIPEQHFHWTQKANIEDFLQWALTLNEGTLPPSPGEVVVYQDIPLLGLKSIWVSQSSANAMRDLLEQNGIIKVNGFDLKDFIRSPQ